MTSPIELRFDQSAWPRVATARSRILDWALWASRAAAHLGVLVGAAAAAIVTFASLSFGVRPPWSLLAMAFCVTFPCYALDRCIDRAADHLTHPERARTLSRRGPVLLLAALVLAGAVVLALRGRGLAGAAVLLLFPLSAILYSAPWLPGLGRGARRIRRIKDVPGIKAPYAAACWTFLIPLTAMYMPGAPTTTRLLAVWAQCFLWVVINAVACDLRDIEADRAAGIVTLPVRLGVERTVRLLQIANAAAFVFCALAVVAGWLPALALATNLQPPLVALYLDRIRRPGADLRAWCDLAPDATLVVQLPFSAAGALLLGSS